MRTHKNLTACLALAIVLAVAPGRAAAQLQPTSDLLVPYFEVDLQPSGITTLFAVGNALDKPVDVLATVHTNWGIAILEVPFTLQPREVRTVNLRDWLHNGGQPGSKISILELQHLMAAVTGQPSPKDHLYYSTEVKPDLAVGYVTLRTQIARPDALWGDWFVVDAGQNLASGDVLVNIDRSTGCPGLCDRHLLRYLTGGGFDGGTEVIIWRESSLHPSPNAEPSTRLQADATAFSEPGQAMENRQLALLPVEKVTVAELGLTRPFGSLDVETEGASFIGVQHSAENRYAVGLQAYCLERKPPIGPGIEIVKLTNGQDANLPPGPSIPVGSTVTWEYLVTNTGDVPLTDVTVSDDQGVKVSCPADSLAAGQSMTCKATGTAVACQYANVGTATGLPPTGPEVSDTDSSHYFGDEGAALTVDLSVNGQPAGPAPGPKVPVGSKLDWSGRVTNSGRVRLTGIEVSADGGLALSCPRRELGAGESMACTGNGTAAEGEHHVSVVARGQGACSNVSGSGDGTYTGQKTDPGLEIVKLTNGQDANLPPGPSIPVGAPVLWEYKVTNTGHVALSGLHVTDDRGVAVSCPKSSLQPGESMTCTGHGTATACQYANLGTVSGTTPAGQTLTGSDPSHYFGAANPAILIETAVNGQDADTAKGPSIPAGSPVSFTSVVRNTGNIALSGIQVSDSKGAPLSCPKSSLQPAESMTCTGSGVAQEGQYSSVGTASGQPTCGSAVSDDDPVNYFGEPLQPGLELIKLTNGQDANTPPGPSIPVGGAVAWEYRVTNTGEVALSNVTVTDDKGVAVSCPKTSLQPGESMTCTGSGSAEACQYVNLGTATAKTPNGQTLTATDLSHYFGVGHPAVQIETAVDGQDADSPQGPEIAAGSAVSFTYVVKNTGDVALSNVQVSDSEGVALTCPKSSLQPGESMTCTGGGTAQPGQYGSVGTVTGAPSCGQAVSDDDPVHYYGTTTTGNQGCTPGYWKNHTDSWPPTGYSPSQKVQSVFSQASLYPSLGNATLHEALSFQGGSDLTGASGILLRAATASLLNTSHPGVDFPRVTAQVIGDVDAALASNNRDTILSLASALDDDNNLGCPLN
jgi:hypothetical protein